METILKKITPSRADEKRLKETRAKKSKGMIPLQL